MWHGYHQLLNYDTIIIHNNIILCTLPFYRVHNSHLHNKRTQKYIRVLENRLDKVKNLISSLIIQVIYY